MFKIRETFFQTAAATAVVAALSALPASGSEVATRSVATAPTESTVVAIDNRNPIASSDALAVRRKPKPIRVVQTSHPRLAAVSHHVRSCSGSWCGRQFVLILGISY
jgi:hypothetical protein